MKKKLFPTLLFNYLSFNYLFCFVFLGYTLYPNKILAQKNNNQKLPFELTRIEPKEWWVGMQNKELQILLYGKNIGTAEVKIGKSDAGNIKILRTEKPENQNYIFLYVDLADAKAGKFEIILTKEKEKKPIIHTYTLLTPEKPREQYVGFTPADVIYLVMPDRFANGDPKNDVVKEMNPKAIHNRNEPFGRHGGDLLGIEKNLDYFAKMGYTALWLNPPQENNQPDQSYHGYAITDFYKIDARCGTNEDFGRLVKSARQKNLKIILDMVFNHCGSEHWFIKDLPMKDWIHQFPEFTQSNYRLSTTVDPYVSQFDYDKMQMGWFDRHMPDLNQRNPHLATYLIQNSIWWIQYFGIEGIRMDTHPYPYPDFMAKWCEAVFREYPNFNIVGEVWESSAITSAYWQKNSKNAKNYNSNLPSLTDFPVSDALNGAFNENDGWNTGLSKIYYALVQDGIYPNPEQNVIFLDNHDVSRYATNTGKDLRKIKMGLAYLATLRGVPQVFYGTEILMEGGGDNHGKLRGDFPGGWAGDKVNAFTQEGLTNDQKDLQNYTQKLFNWRKSATAVHTGKMMHFVPDNNVYVHFRYNDNNSVMVLGNNSNDPRKVDTKRFQERMKGYTSAKNALTGETITNLSELLLPAKSVTILELMK